MGSTKVCVLPKIDVKGLRQELSTSTLTVPPRTKLYCSIFDEKKTDCRGGDVSEIYQYRLTRSEKKKETNKRKSNVSL